MLGVRKKVHFSALIATFIGINIVFIFLQISKSSKFNEVLLQHQRLEKEKDILVKEQNELTYKIHQHQSRRNIKKHVTKELGMRQAKLGQVQKASDALGK